MSQHLGSIAQIFWQQTGSLQLGFSCGTRQLPVAGSPHVSVTMTARATQEASHSALQHVGWIAQTASHTAPLLQEGDGCGTKQLSGTPPQFEQNLVARATQRSSHAAAQQAGSIEQTSAQHDGLLHPPARRFGVKQSLVAFTQPWPWAWVERPPIESRIEATTANAEAMQVEQRLRRVRRSRMRAFTDWIDARCRVRG